ncbi:MAG: hypothetical protein PHP98_10250 [Kiritimatiellae bacterium]|nr:hypothetical protein [Kiritimatiellia bacterium]
MAVLYLAYAQENGVEPQNAGQAAQAPAGESQSPCPTAETATVNGAGGQASLPNAPAAAAEGQSPEAQNGNGRAIELPVGGDVSAAGALAGANTNLISISLDNVPVQDVVNMFAQISGANIITSGSFTNVFVTANLKNVEWKTALKLALGSVNLAMIEDPSGILMVVTSEMYRDKIQQIEETKPLVTRTFMPKYLSAVDLIEQIKLLKILSPRGAIITSQSKEQDKVSLKSTGNASEGVTQNPSITTAIVVSDIKEYVDKVEALIAQLDRREPQVFIEARIIDVGVSYNQKLGFDWGMLERFGVGASLQDAQWKFSDDRTETASTDARNNQWDKRQRKDTLKPRYDKDGMPYEESTTTWEESPPGSGNWVQKTTLTPTREIDDIVDVGRDITLDRRDNVVDTFSEGKMGAMVLSATDVALYLSALKQTGNADMLSHPVLIVGNRVEAKIHVGEQTWRISLKKTKDGTGVNISENYSEDAAPVDLGLKLWVIPEIDVANESVRMTIEPEMTVWVKDITTAQGSVYPVISTRRISTRVNVPSAHTVVIGGLVENKKSKAEKRVPLLGDIPLLGLLFRHTEDVDEKKNLLIMLTPTILDEDKPLTGMEAIAQLTVNKFEQAPLLAVGNAATNQADAQPLATNLFTPSSGFAPAVPADSPSPAAPDSTAAPVSPVAPVTPAAEGNAQPSAAPPSDAGTH